MGGSLVRRLAVAHRLGPMSGRAVAVAHGGDGRHVRGCDRRSVLLAELGTVRMRVCCPRLEGAGGWRRRGLLGGSGPQLVDGVPWPVAAGAVGAVRRAASGGRRDGGSPMLGRQRYGGCGGTDTCGRQGGAPHLVAGRKVAMRGCAGPITPSRMSRFRRCGSRHHWGFEGRRSIGAGFCSARSAPPAPMPAGRSEAVKDRRLVAGAVGPADALVGRPGKWLARCAPCSRKGWGSVAWRSLLRTACAGQALFTDGPHPLMSVARGYVPAAVCLAVPRGGLQRQLLFARPFDCRDVQALAATRTVWARCEAWRAWVRGGCPPALVQPRRLPPWRGHLPVVNAGGSQLLRLRCGVRLPPRSAAGGPCRPSELLTGAAVAALLSGAFDPALNAYPAARRLARALAVGA